MAVTFADLERVRREIMRELGNAVAQLFGNTRIASASPLGESDGVEKADDATDPDGQKGQRPTVRLHPFGFISRPPKGLRGLWLRIGSSNVVVIGLIPQQSYGPQSLNPGETALYNFGAAQILLDQNDQITISSGTSQITVVKNGDVNVVAGGNIKFAGGGPAVARSGDACQVTIPANTYAPYVSGVSPAVVAPGTITAGSTKVQSG